MVIELLRVLGCLWICSGRFVKVHVIIRFVAREGSQCSLRRDIAAPIPNIDRLVMEWLMEGDVVIVVHVLGIIEAGVLTAIAGRLDWKWIV